MAIEKVCNFYAIECDYCDEVLLNACSMSDAIAMIDDEGWHTLEEGMLMCPECVNTHLDDELVMAL